MHWSSDDSGFVGRDLEAENHLAPNFSEGFGARSVPEFFIFQGGRKNYNTIGGGFRDLNHDPILRAG